MDQEQIESLMDLWEHETEDEETWEWRDELTPEEAKLVEGWDKSWGSGVLRLCEDILESDRRIQGQGGRQQAQDRPSLYESQQPSMQEQLGAAAAEAGERNAGCQAVLAAALDAER